MIFYLRQNASKPIITLFPGSRKQEVKRHLPILLKTADKLKRNNKNIQFIVGVAKHINIENWDIAICSYRGGVCIFGCIKRSQCAQRFYAIYKIGLQQDHILVILYYQHPNSLEQVMVEKGQFSQAELEAAWSNAGGGAG